MGALGGLEPSHQPRRPLPGRLDQVRVCRPRPPTYGGPGAKDSQQVLFVPRNHSYLLRFAPRRDDLPGPSCLTHRYSDGHWNQQNPRYRDHRGLSWDQSQGYSQPWHHDHPPQPLPHNGHSGHNGYSRPEPPLSNGYTRPEAPQAQCWHPPPTPAYPAYPSNGHLPPTAAVARRSCLRRSDAVKTPWPEASVQVVRPGEVARHSWHPVRQSTLPTYTDYPAQPNYPNGTYPGESLVRAHRKLPAVPKNKFAHQQSLPNNYSNPYRRESCVSKISSYFKPLGPIKPSSLSIRQSSALNGSPSYTLMGAQHFQMPIVSESPTLLGQTDSLVAMNGWIGEHHRTLPQNPHRQYEPRERRSLPQPPVSSSHPPPGPQKPLSNGGFGLSDLFSRTSRDFDWI